MWSHWMFFFSFYSFCSFLAQFLIVVELFSFKDEVGLISSIQYFLICRVDYLPVCTISVQVVTKNIHVTKFLWTFLTLYSNQQSILTARFKPAPICLSCRCSIIVTCLMYYSKLLKAIDLEGLRPSRRGNFTLRSQFKRFLIHYYDLSLTLRC